jgi:hypothetical protein
LKVLGTFWNLKTSQNYAEGLHILLNFFKVSKSFWKLPTTVAAYVKTSVNFWELPNPSSKFQRSSINFPTLL